MGIIATCSISCSIPCKLFTRYCSSITSGWLVNSQVQDQHTITSIHVGKGMGIVATSSISRSIPCKLFTCNFSSVGSYHRKLIHNEFHWTKSFAIYINIMSTHSVINTIKRIRTSITYSYCCILSKWEIENICQIATFSGSTILFVLTLRWVFNIVHWPFIPLSLTNHSISFYYLGLIDY